jgi:WD40 repeat protein
MCATYNTDGTKLASGSDDFSTKIWIPLLGTLLYSINCGTFVDSLSFSSVDSRYLAIGVRGFGTYIYDAESGNELLKLEEGGSRVCYATSDMILM